MDRMSRPVIVARVVRIAAEVQVRTQHNAISLPPAAVPLFNYLDAHADGRQTIADLATVEHDESVLLRLVNQLEQLGVCYDAHLLAQFGQRAGNYPDPLRVMPDEVALYQLVKLPKDPPGLFLSADQEYAPTRRRLTCRDFTDQPITFGELCRIASAGYGVIENVHGFLRRTTPSAGGMYPLQVDYLVRRGDDIEPGLYRWAKHRNGFILLSRPSNEQLAPIFLGDDWRSAAIVQLISYDIRRSAAKYASRAHRFALIEAGHVAQNSMIMAHDLGLGSWENGGTADQAMAELLGVDSVSGGIATMVLYGRIA